MTIAFFSDVHGNLPTLAVETSPLPNEYAHMLRKAY
jgi:hypothetical protein